MRINFRSAALAFVLASVASVGCTNPSSSSEETAASDEDLSGSAFTGYYELADQTNNDTWIEQLALHKDGSFEANMGNDVSNLSGHHYATTGTFGFSQHGSTSVLTLHAVGTFAGDTSFDIALSGKKLTVRQHGVATSFAMQAASIVTLTFNADWTITQTGPIVANQSYLVRYAASRNDCAAPAGGGVTLAALGQFENGVTTTITQEFNSQPVKGMLGAFGSVPPLGHDLAVWFKGGAETSNGASTSCTHWDSNLAKNYHFPITGG